MVAFPILIKSFYTVQIPIAFLQDLNIWLNRFDSAIFSYIPKVVIIIPSCNYSKRLSFSF